MDGQNNQYGSYNYGGMNGTGNWQQPPNQKKDGIAFGVASLVLGIISLLLFCTCLNWMLAVLAIIFGIIQLTLYRKKGLAVGGIVTAGLSLVFSILFYFFFIGIGLAEGGYGDFYYDSYYYDDGYCDDSYYYEDYYDEYFDESGENEFLKGSSIYL